MTRYHTFRPGVIGLAPGAAPSRALVGTELASQPRNGLPPHKPYVYRGTGRDELTAWMDYEPDSGPRLTRRRERLERLAELRLHEGTDPEAPAGAVTAREAAELLGVDVRTIERYKRELRRTA